MGVEVAGDGDRRAGVDQGAGRRRRAPTPSNTTARQQGGDGARAGSSRRPICGDVLEVIDARGAMSDRQGQAAGAARTLDVHLAAHAEGGGAFQVARIEVLARDGLVPPEVDELGQARGAGCAAQLVDDLLGVGVRAAARDRAGGRSGRCRWGRIRRAAITRSALSSALSSGPQPVLISTVVSPWRAMASSSGRERDSRRVAVQSRMARAALSLSRPCVPARRIDQVRMAVDEAGHYHAAGGVDFEGPAGGREILDAAAGSDFFDDAVAQQQRAIGDDFELVEIGSAPRAFRTAQGQQLPRAPNQNRTGLQSSIIGLWPKRRNTRTNAASKLWNACSRRRV